jgi:hypothetical protein
MWNADAIERQLAHVDNDSVRRAYARADYWEERVRMMDWWTDRCGLVVLSFLCEPYEGYWANHGSLRKNLTALF